MDLNEIFRLRFIWSSLSSTLFNSAYIILAYFAGQLTSLSFSSIFLFWPIFSILWAAMLLSINSVLSVLVCKHVFANLRVFDETHNKKYGYFLSLFQHRNLKFSTIACLLAFCQAWIVLEFIEYNSMNQDANDISRSLWLSGFGGFVAFLWCVVTTAHNLLTVTYASNPIFYSEIFVNTIKRNLLRSFGRIIYFFTLYSLVCVIIFQRVSLRTGLLSHIDLQFLLEMFVVCFYINASWSSALMLLQNTLTQNLNSDSGTNSSISEVIQDFFLTSYNGLLHHLTLGRLADAVVTDSQIRFQIFSITDLNGQAILWQRVSRICLEKLDVFLLGLQNVNKNLSENYFKNINKNLQPRHMRDSHLLSNSVMFNINEYADTLDNGILQVSSHAIKFGANLPGIHYLLRDVPCAETASILSSGGACVLPNSSLVTIHSVGKESRLSGQAVIWCIQVLGCLTLASYTEDKLGSVQKNLGRILTLFSETLETLEKHYRLAGLKLTKRMTENKSLNVDYQSGFGSQRMDKTTSLLDHNESLDGEIEADEEEQRPYFQYSSDADLPRRIHLTLTWALTNCLRQFGSHLRTINMDAKRRNMLELLWQSMQNQ